MSVELDLELETIERLKANIAKFEEQFRSKVRLLHEFMWAEVEPNVDPDLGRDCQLK